MTKEQIIKGAIALINHIAEERGLTVEDRGTGHAFDNSFWNFTDKGCDWAAYGLFDICKVHVDGQPVFEFAE